MNLLTGRNTPNFAKDTVYRFMKMTQINWMHFTTLFASRIMKEAIVPLNSQERANVLIIDDICSYGNTFVKAAEAIQAAGAVDISLYITHCEDAISKGDIFKKDIFENVFTTNSLIRSEETNSKLTIIH